MRGLWKDNTGYDLKHLFIGAEGTLGIITEAAILCPLQPKFLTVAFLNCDNFDQVVQINNLAKSKLIDLTAIEYLDSISLEVVKSEMKLESPLDHSNFYVLIEVSSNNPDSCNQ